MVPVSVVGTGTRKRGSTLMPAVLPSGLTMVRLGQSLAHVLTVTVLAVPLVIATVALIPALAICPFLGTRRQRLVIRLLASLQQWAVALAGARQRPVLVPRTRG